MRDRIAAALQDAMLGKDRVRTGALRLMLAAIRDREIAARGEDGDGTLDQKDVVALLSRMVRQRQESIGEYERAGRMELAEQERDEIRVIREFLPKPLTEAEVDAAIAAAVRETGAASIRDIGKVMAQLKSRHAGRMDFTAANARVKAALG